MGNYLHSYTKYISHTYYKLKFILDGMVTNRDDNHAGSGVQERVLSVLLNEMDGIGSNYKVS